jgi:hypothetical protein
MTVWRPVPSFVIEVWMGDHGIPAGSPRPHRYEAPHGFAVFQTRGPSETPAVRSANRDQGLRRRTDLKVTAEAKREGEPDTMADDFCWEPVALMRSDCWYVHGAHMPHRFVGVQTSRFISQGR